MSIWYAIFGVMVLSYLALVAWVLVEAIHAPLIDDATARQAYRDWSAAHPRLLRGRLRGLHADRSGTPGPVA